MPRLGKCGCYSLKQNSQAGKNCSDLVDFALFHRRPYNEHLFPCLLVGIAQFHPGIVSTIRIVDDYGTRLELEIGRYEAAEYSRPGKNLLNPREK